MSVYVLGGAQTDFARNLAREKKTIVDLFRESIPAALADAKVRAEDVGVVHIGNFAAELFVGQGHLGGLVAEAEPLLSGVPASRHEAACASGSMALLAATADLEAGRYDVALVLGVEMMRNVAAFESQKMLAAAAWVPFETDGIAYPWPHAFSRLGDVYEERYGLDRAHLVALSKSAFANAKRNPQAQTRGWSLESETGEFGAFESDARNPVFAGRIRKLDCSQVTDGAAAVVLVHARALEAHRSNHVQYARIEGWGHTTVRMSLEPKLADRSSPYVFPHVRRAIQQALERANTSVASVDAIEAHDCFSTTAYMAIDHFGVTEPGQSHRAIDDGTVLFGGKKPLNPSGGLIGLGHPVGATGVRMLLDAANQVRSRAGDCQVENARRVATLNIGGSTTTTAAFVVGRAES